VRNVKRTLKLIDNGGDELFYIKQQCKAGECYVRSINSSPKPAIVIASDKQLHDLSRFCSSNTHNKISIVTVDPTFSLGDFECTPTTYRHLLLITRRNKVHPVFLGPVLIHYRKNFSTFLYFASTIIGLKKDLSNLKVFGTDGEKSLVEAFKHEFKHAIHLYCTIHMRNNVRDELRRRKFPEAVIKDIADTIFGKQVYSVYVEDLTDSDDEMFWDKLHECKEKCSKLEKENGCVTGFYQWFSMYKALEIVSGMLKPLRIDAGLGSPPAHFTTNSSESINAILKRKKDFKNNELPEFVRKLKELIDEQERELERAVAGRGKFQFCEEFQHLQMEEAKWYEMTHQQRKKHLEKIHNEHVKQYQLTNDEETQSTTALFRSLSGRGL
jgi:hypothetical protein